MIRFADLICLPQNLIYSASSVSKRSSRRLLRITITVTPTSAKMASARLLVSITAKPTKRSFVAMASRMLILMS